MNVRYNKLKHELTVLKNKIENRDGIPTEAERRRAEEIMDAMDVLEAAADVAGSTMDKRLFPGGGSRQNYNRRTSDGPFNSIGEQVRAVIAAGSPGGQTDPRLHEVRAATGLSEGIGGDGGFLVQPEFSYDLVQGMFDTGFLAGRTTRFNVGANKNRLELPAIDETSRVTGSRWGGIRLYHISEAGVKTASKPKFRKMELNLQKLAGICYVTDELMEDVNALDAYIRMGFREEFAFMIDNIILNGSGAGQGLGVLNSGSLVTQNYETGQPAATINYENVKNMWSRLLPKCRNNAVWCVSHAAEGQLWGLSQAVGTGGAPVFLPASGASERPYSTLFGRPVMVLEQCPDLGTVGDIILMDPSWVVMADKGGIKEDISIHVRFLYDESILRFVYRYDLQPILASAITPANSGDTLSSHVALQSRT